MAKVACVVALSLMAFFAFNSFAYAQDSVNDKILRDLGRRFGRVVITLLWNLETLRDESQKLSVESLEDILGLPRQPHAIREVLEDVVTTVNKGKPLNGDQIEAMQEILDISTILDFPLPRLLKIAEYVNITKIIEVEFEFGLFGQATELIEHTTTTVEPDTGFQGLPS